ncbi:nucleotidyltransferase family protein [Chamaesiphon sp. VAR_48_metabat_135_sub]|uniref:nucleotidyltransferase domain-containing protein n=1 Tax=Chamaesiphon sp. VAR_48_metabat_135_sub TaxID=2964699 RepID=UPI00286CF956|nr:nucleotidyltransferase family protein [Chamaesiphon sp. VAR_48_metabat_135_sub]
MKLASTITLEQNDRQFERQSEIELLLCCSRTHPDSLQINQIQALVRQPLDWNYILERATYHNVLPLLDRQIQQLKPGTIPTEVIEQLQANFNENFQRNLHLTAELVKLSRLFESQSIPMMSFKGPILAQIAYGNLALRQFVDLDILVAEADVLATSQLLISQGYESQFALTDRQQTVYTGLRSEQWFWHEEKQLCIDLHWSILPKYYSFTPDRQLLWTKTNLVEFGSQSVTTLNAEHLLLFLCAHGSKHNWSKLYWICDIAELLRTNRDLDWEYISSLVGKFGTQRMLWLGLYLAHQLFSANLPESLLFQLESDSKLPILFTQIKEIIFHPQAICAGLVEKTSTNSQDAVYRQTMTSFRDRSWYWIDTILTPTPLEWQIVTLPQALFPLYYLIRLIRLSLKHIFRVSEA